MHWSQLLRFFWYSEQIIGQSVSQLDRDRRDVHDKANTDSIFFASSFFVFIALYLYSYNRWWEAYTAVYLMHSKWLDLATEIAAFHYQSRRYNKYKPPSFGANPCVQSLDHHSTSKFYDSNLQFNRNNMRDHRDFDESSMFSFGTSIAELPTATRSGKADDLTPPPSPGNQSSVKSIKSIPPNRRVRQAKERSYKEIIQQIDAAEAEEEQMKLQSLSLLELKQINENEEARDNNAGGGGTPDEIDSEIGEGEDNIAVEGKKSWLQKIKRRRSYSKKSERKTNRVRIADGLPVTTINEDSESLNLPRTLWRKERSMKRRRSRHQPATARLFNQRKSIAIGKESTIPHEEQLEFRDRIDSKTGKSYSTFTAYSRKHLREGNLDPDEIPPMLFLEECAHLLSLMSAVAFSTLRNDLPEAESPLTVFEPGLPWPLVDPDGYKSNYRKGWAQSKSRLYSALQFALGRSRNDKARTLYNAARPFRVIGNVSDAEIEKLQEARGPLAKVSLVSMWLLELISREYQVGSTGDVASPIISRLYAFVSEGLAGYNQARKIAYIPFPFPHAQITTLYLGIVDFFVAPLLMVTFVTDITLGCFLNLFSVLCFTGLHEVAREIENPFQNVPNDVPLNNYQAQFNEGLMVMFYGYHPDAYWSENQENCNSSGAGTSQSSQNNTSPKPSTTMLVDTGEETFQLPDLTKIQPLLQSKPIDGAVEENHQEESGLNKRTISGGLKNVSDTEKNNHDKPTVDTLTNEIPPSVVDGLNEEEE